MRGELGQVGPLRYDDRVHGHLRSVQHDIAGELRLLAGRLEIERLSTPAWRWLRRWRLRSQAAKLRHHAKAEPGWFFREMSA